MLDKDGIEAPKSVRVMIGVPCGDDVKAGFAYDLAKLCAATAVNAPHIELRLEFNRSSLLPKQREELCAAAVERGMTHILMLDSDMRFPKDILVRLLERDVDFVGCNYATRRLPLQPTAFTDEKDARKRLLTDEESTGLVDVFAIGTGIVLVRTEALKRMQKPWFMVGWHPAGSHVGEDVFFSARARAAGVIPYVDQDQSRRIQHLGEWEYDLSQIAPMLEEEEAAR